MSLSAPAGDYADMGGRRLFFTDSISEKSQQIKKTMPSLSLFFAAPLRGSELAEGNVLANAESMTFPPPEKPMMLPTR